MFYQEHYAAGQKFKDILRAAGEELAEVEERISPRYEQRSTSRILLPGFLILLGSCLEAAPTGGAPEPDGFASTVDASAPSPSTPSWGALASIQIDQPAVLTGLTLAPAPKMGTLLSYSLRNDSTQEERTAVGFWSAGRWQEFGELVGSGPAVAVDHKQRVYVCSTPGPFVRRWNGSHWNDLGGDIDEEIGAPWQPGPWQVEPSCTSLVVDGSGRPTLVWTTASGRIRPQPSSHMARWNEQVQKWQAFPLPPIGWEAISSLGIDAQGRLYALSHHFAAFVPTNHVFRWNGQDWAPLGKLPDGSASALAVHDQAVYVVVSSDPDLKVLSWERDVWRDLPSAGEAEVFALDTTPSGKPVLALLGSTLTYPYQIQVKFFDSGSWQQVGAPIVATGLPETLPDFFHLSVDARGFATVGWWTRTGPSAVRYDAPLP